LRKYIEPYNSKNFIVKTSEKKDFIEEKQSNINAINILGTDYSLLHKLIGFSITNSKDLEKFYICNIKGTPIFQNSLNVVSLKKYCSDILHGLSLLSKHGYSHNDVKIENTMYNEIQKKYVLIDFGKLSNGSKLKMDNLCGFNRDYRLFKLLNMGNKLTGLAVNVCKYEALSVSKHKHKQLGTQWYIEVYKTKFWITWEKFIQEEYNAFKEALKTHSNATNDKLKSHILKYSDLYMFGVSIVYLLCKYHNTLKQQDYTFFIHLIISLTVNDKQMQKSVELSFPHILSVVKSFTFKALPIPFQEFFHSQQTLKTKTKKKNKNKSRKSL
jgi:serine/threonine protein kinase